MAEFVYIPRNKKSTTGVDTTSFPQIDLTRTSESTQPVMLDRPTGGKFLLPAVAKATPSLAKEIAQGTARDIATLPSVASGKQSFVYTPRTRLEKAAFGEKPFSAEKEAVEFGEVIGVPEDVSRKYGPLAIGALTVGDILSVPGKKRLLVKVLKNADSVTDVRKILKAEGIADDVIFGIEKSLVRAKTDDTVEAALKSASPSKTPTVKRTDIVPPTTTKERKFITGVKTMQPENTKLAGQYIPRSTDELAERARKLIADDPSQATKVARGSFDDFAVAVSSEMINKLTKEADQALKRGDELLNNQLLDQSADIANNIAENLTEAGRGIQAASLLNRMTPAGQLRVAKRSVENFNRKNPLRKIPEITPKQTREILKEADEIMRITDPAEKAMRYKKFQEKVSALVPTPMWKKVTQVWKAGLLTGLKTSGLNVMSTASNFAAELIKDVPASLVDNVASLFTGKRTKAFPFTKQQLEAAFDGIKEGTIKGKRYFFTGFDERNVGAKLDYKKINFGKGPVAKGFQFYSDTVFRTLGAQDQPWYYAAAARSLADQGFAAGKNLGLKGDELADFVYRFADNADEKAIRTSVIDGQTAVFQNKTELGKLAKGVKI